jgi:hypothetical protein
MLEQNLPPVLTSKLLQRRGCPDHPLLGGLGLDDPTQTQGGVASIWKGTPQNRPPECAKLGKKFSFFISF